MFSKELTGYGNTGYMYFYEKLKTSVALKEVHDQ